MKRLDFEAILMSHRIQHPEDRDLPDGVILYAYLTHGYKPENRFLAWCKNFLKCVWSKDWLHHIGGH